MVTFTQCTTGTIAEFFYGSYKDGDWCKNTKPVEVWDEKGTPYVASDCGLQSADDYAETMGSTFMGLFNPSDKEWTMNDKHIAVFSNGTMPVVKWSENGDAMVLRPDGKLVAARTAATFLHLERADQR